MSKRDLKIVWQTLAYVNVAMVMIDAVSFAASGFSRGATVEMFATTSLLLAAFWTAFICWWRRATQEERGRILPLGGSNATNT